MDHQPDIAPAEAAAVGIASPLRRRGGWLRRMYTPVGAPEQAAPAAADDRRPRRRGGWLRRLVPRERALRRRWKVLSGAPSRLAAGLPRWKRASAGGGWASALLDAATFRVMYVVEAVVLGLALSCFFCCCGCQI